MNRDEKLEKAIEAWSEAKADKAAAKEYYFEAEKLYEAAAEALDAEVFEAALKKHSDENK